VRYGNLPLPELLDAVGAATPAPASGTAAALAAALGAALAELAAGVTGDESAAAEARRLRADLVALADEDADAYTEFLRMRSDDARARIVLVPDTIAARADAVAALGDRLVETGKSSVRGDALAAAELARGAAAAARHLVAINQA
jgi:formiminotetrahydrofolate cyclodeaminase